MSRSGRFASRILFALALIVQILAPVGSNAAVMRVAFDPTVDVIVCAHDQEIVDRRADFDRTAVHHGDACGLCQLVAAGGHAPPVAAPALVVPCTPAIAAVEWRIGVEAVVATRLLDHIRGRAPPTLS